MNNYKKIKLIYNLRYNNFKDFKMNKKIVNKNSKLKIKNYKT